MITKRLFLIIGLALSVVTGSKAEDMDNKNVTSTFLNNPNFTTKDATATSNGDNYASWWVSNKTVGNTADGNFNVMEKGIEIYNYDVTGKEFTLYQTTKKS